MSAQEMLLEINRKNRDKTPQNEKEQSARSEKEEEKGKTGFTKEDKKFIEQVLMENIKIKMDEVKAHRETATKMNLHKTGRQFNMT